MDVLILEPKKLLDIEWLVDCVARYLSANDCPNWAAKRVDFHCGEGQSNCWLVSKMKNDTLLRVTEVYMKRHGLYTPYGYCYISMAWNDAMFCVNGTNYYYMSK